MNSGYKKFVGFQMPKRQPTGQSMNAVPPPSSGLSKQGYSTMSAITQNAMSATWGSYNKKRTKTEDEYFDEDDEPPAPSLEYIPAPGSPSYQQAGESKNADEDEEDPLDAFMAGLEKQQQKQTHIKIAPSTAAAGSSGAGSSSAITGRGTRGDIEEEDDEETYYKYMEENPLNGNEEGSDNEIEYDEDGNPIAPPKKKIIDPLPPMDHSSVQYAPFEKNFYTPHPDIQALSKQQTDDLKKTLGVNISGAQPPQPVASFSHFGFDENLMKSIRRAEYSTPTPIQAAGMPAALSGRDIIGIAKTGSGKTAAYLLPLLVHIMDQKELSPGDGPIGLILAPTRELAQQIYMEAKRFGKVYNIQAVCCYGGGSKWEQSKAFEAGAEIVVATPGRMIDMVKMKATNLQRVTYLVIDEADRMFNMGFEGQVRSICNHVRPDRQTLLFSATFPKRVEKLTRDALRDPVRIQQGQACEANADVKQVVRILKNPQQKWNWLLGNLTEFTCSGSVLIFVTKKVEAEQLAGNLNVHQFDALLIHGDMDQVERNKVITAFKRQQSPILVATDVAARGLDFPHIRTVVNYDVARDIDTHTHRVGRTGRAGVKGDAITLLLVDKDKEFAGHLVRNFEGSNQEVPQTLLDLAMQSSWFKKSRFKAGKGKNLNVSGAGLGFKERPGLKTHSFRDEDATEMACNEAKKGPATDRLSAMKAAFKMQYQQFTAASDDAWQKCTNQEALRGETSQQTEQKRKNTDEGCFVAPMPPPMSAPPPPIPPPIERDRQPREERVRKSGKRSRWE